ncbi:VOC family protein [Chitinophaga sp.]|uniref:VOC family protein n=1 Tax=Chitinophaga sp. TaxID=1869181 RepID=UPI002F91D7CA
MAAVNPYLTFDGTCEVAFNLYKKAFGGEFLMISRFGDMPAGDGSPEQCGPADKDKIMHVALPIGKNTILMGSDGPGNIPITAGNQFSVAIQADSEAEADHLFNSLSAGGQVFMPMGKAPWGAYFGMFADQFGIQWLINFDYAQQS